MESRIIAPSVCSERAHWKCSCGALAQPYSYSLCVSVISVESRQLSQAELRTKHLQQELDQARENCQRLTRDRLALREEVHSLTESVQRYKAEHLQDKLNLKASYQLGHGIGDA